MKNFFPYLPLRVYDSGDMSLCYSDSDTTKRRKLFFQNKWLDRHTWLHYGSCRGNSGGWCIPCILFVSEVEKTALGQFVTSSFTSYYKSKEMFNKHSSKNYHKMAMERAYAFQQCHANRTQRIDVRMSDIGVKNFTFNEAERSFSCLRQVHNWLRSTMTEERLGSLGVLAIHGFKYPIDVQEVCDKFKQIHPRKMTNSSLLVADANV